MLFTINDLGFSIAGLLLEGWLAFAARCVCALALLFIGWVVSRWLQKSLFPRLLKRSWHFAFTHPLLESFARPAARIAWYTGMYLALRSLPWAIPGLAALLLKAYRMMLPRTEKVTPADCKVTAVRSIRHLAEKDSSTRAAIIS